MAAARLTKNNSSRKESNAVLLVTDQYATSKEEDVSTMTRQVVQILTGAGRKVYSLVLEDTEEDRKCAEADGVELILPTRAKEDTRTPSLDWLTFDHRAHYPELPKDVGWIVGHATITSNAATAIKEQRFPQAKLSLVIKTIPENTEKYKEEEKAMGIGKKEDSIREDAAKADTVFSVGHQVHDHFMNTFCAISEDKRPIHYLLLPEPSNMFQKTTVQYRETKEKVVLLVSKVNEVEKQKGLDFAAKSISRVAERGGDRIQLRIRGVSEEEYQASMNILQKSINSGKLIPTLLPHGTQEDICRDMQQAHLVLMPSRTEPFGLIGLEAMAAGVPVLISDQSGLATLVKKVIPEFHHSVLGITGDDSMDVKQWADQIEKVLQMSAAEFSRAAALKQKLLESKYWEESHQRFLQAFGVAGNTAQEPTKSQEKKRSADHIGEINEGGKHFKQDISGLGELWFMYKNGKLNDLLVSSLISKETLQQLCAESISVKTTINIEDFRKALVYILTMSTPKGTEPEDPDCTVEDIEVQEITSESVFTSAAALGTQDDQQTTEAPEGTDMHKVISELASLELEQQMGRPRRPRRRSSSAGGQDFNARLNYLFAELNTPAVMEDKAQQFDLYCQIGDLYRTKLHNVQSALEYYQNMLECSQALPEDTKQAKAYCRLGLTFGMLGEEQQAYVNHHRALGIFKIELERDSDICVAYKNLASSLALSGQVSDAKTNYESALAVAMETGNKTEQMDIYCKLGDLHREQLYEPQVSHGYYSEMLTLAKDLGRKDWERFAYNRLGLACGDMQDNEAALKWDQKVLKMRQDDGDKEAQITAHINVGDTYRRLGKLDQATSHFNTALQMAQQTGDQHGQMDIYCKLGDLHREQLYEPQVSHGYYSEMLTLAKDLGRKDWERLAYNRLGLACGDMQDNEAALEWDQKVLKMRQDDGDKEAQITAHINVGDTYRRLGKLDQATSHLNTALQMAQQTGINMDR
ncbi:TTC28 [Branchiostoma lanceolatum]|uniref:TTC28 protein n=1 Tax=Branchiostoma lanceolatum TaxID=7740 RepID=A0A8J9ZBR4_BRALA|nr:TTC28 [Branchiostoma lanceolatum]